MSNKSRFKLEKAEDFKAVKESLGMTGFQVSELCCLEKSMWGRYERGERYPHRHTLELIRMCLDMHLRGERR